MPAMEKLLHTTGTGGVYPCRFCLIRGFWAKSGNGKGGAYYYPSKDPLNAPDKDKLRPHNENCYNWRNLPLRGQNETNQILERIKSITTDIRRYFINLTTRTNKNINKELDALGKSTGIKGCCSLFKLPTLIPFKSFPVGI